jgi:predicted O-methyltransferase YrrM
MASPIHRLLDALRGIPALSPLAFALLLRRPGRLPVFLSDCWRAFRHHAGLRLPAMTPWELLSHDTPVSLVLGENGLFAARESSFLLMQLAAMLRPQQIFEIGTNQGRTTALLAMNTPASTRLFTLDLPPDATAPGDVTDRHLVELARQELGSAFRGTSWEPRITQLLGDSSRFDFAPWRNSIDLVIVDASHNLPYVISDTRNAFRIVRPGGVIVWDDYESMRSEYGVSRVVDGLRRRHGIATYRLSRDVGDSRLAVLRVDAECKKRLLALAEQPDAW